jgi:hypothetical protein
VRQQRVSGVGHSASGERDGLLDGVLDVLLGRVELLLEQLDLALEAVGGGARGLALARGLLELRVLALGLLQVGLQHTQLVVERGDVLVALEHDLLVFLVLGLGRLGALVRSVGLGAQRREFLGKDVMSTLISE